MSNESAPREAMEETISQGIGWAEYAWVPQDTGNYNTSRLMFIKSLGKQATDNAIAHLWSRADDPEVVEAVTRTIWAGDYELADGDLKRSLRVSTSVEIVATLSHLLGPRPSGEEAE